MNKIVPKLRFKEFNLNWETRQLKEYLEFKNGLNGDSDKFGSGIRCISVMDILKNQFITYDVIKGQVDIDNTTLNNYSVNYGDILFQRSSENIEDAGSSNVYLDKEKIATFGGFVIRGKKINEYNPYFMNMLLKTLKVRKNIMQKAQGAQHINISQEILEKIEINIPLINEQNKIARIFELLDKKIELQKQKIENLKLYKLYVLNDLFNNKSLQKEKIKNICTIVKGQQYNSNLLLPSGKYYMLNGGINPSGFVNEYNVDRNTISISEGGNSCGFINFNYFPFWSGGHCYTLQNVKINNNYLFQLLKYNQNKIMQLRVGSGLPNIQKSDLENYEIFIHHEEQQIKISRIFKNFDYKIRIEKDKFEQLNQLKRSLLQKMFV